MSLVFDNKEDWSDPHQAYEWRNRAEKAEKERDELLADMRELFAKHSELGPQDDCTCCFGDTCQHCYARQDNLDKCFVKMRKKWGEK